MTGFGISSSDCFLRYLAMLFYAQMLYRVELFKLMIIHVELDGQVSDLF
jgi:hypothetical protein